MSGCQAALFSLQTLTDDICERRQQRWVSLKIPTADSTRQSQELQTLRALQTDDAANHVVRLLDSFVHEGPNGSHQCLVLELLGPSVDYLLENDFNEPGERMERDTILRITKQLLEGLAFVHSAGYAQGGKCHTRPWTSALSTNQQNLQMSALAT